MTLELMPAFLLATAAFAVTPGPAMMYTAARTLAQGRAAGLWAAAGVHAGGYVHVLAAALGLSAAFRHAPDLYLAVKLAGAAYLIWIGLRMLLAPEAPTAAAAPARSGRRAFFDSMLVEVLNPKVALFFVAFLPQFVDAAAGPPIWAQFLILGAVVNLAFSAVDVCVACAAARVAAAARSAPARALLMQRVGGGVLTGLGVRLALARD